MRTDLPGLERAIEAVTANGVPFVALPPEEPTDARGLVLLWHGADPPRSDAALAAAVPLRRLPAWRVYLGMPLYGRRAPAGGFAEVVRLAYQDAVTLVFQPSIGGAVAELPAALDDVRARLGIDAALPLGLFGFSQGGAAALLALCQHEVRFRAAVTWGAAIDLPAVVDAVGNLYGVPYDWTAERRALAERLSTTRCGPALAASGAAILLAFGADDPLPVREPAEQLAAAIRAAGGVAEARMVPGLAHGFVEQPGQEAAPQGPEARAVDALATEWFNRYLF
ncbi:MAG TPA: prolyl oligopeptidase family serine peptidase [Chloroflexota bacterium]|nr:prolyl oligopeptidase family serine peptidase [Chloroflexota bacterium]